MADLNLRVRVLTEGAEKLESLGGRMGRVGRNLTIGLTGPLVAAGGAFIAMAAEAERSDAKLQSVFDSMEASAWTSIDALHEHADALADATTFDDDAVKDAQAVLLTFGEVTGQTFEDATESAADLAAFFETDMNDAALTLGKALQNPVDGLARLGRQGIIFSDEQKAAVAAMQEAGDVAGAQAIILDEVQRQVGNVAEDLAATSSGQLTQAMNELGEAGESMGVLLLPVLSTLADILGGLAQWFQDLDPSVKGFIAAVGGILIVVGPVLLVMSALIGAFSAVEGAFTALGILLLANPFVLLIAAIVALVAIVVLNWDAIVLIFQDALREIASTMQAIGDAIGAAWDAIIGVFDEAVKGIQGIGRRIFKPLADGFTAAIGVIKSIWNAFVRFWNGIQISVPSVNLPVIGKVGGFTFGLPDLPFLAEGGIISDPTLAVLGEKGPEAVIPLDQMPEGGITFNFNGPITGEQRELPGLMLRTLYVAQVGR